MNIKAADNLTIETEANETHTVAGTLTETITGAITETYNSSLTTSINDSPITSAPDMVLSCLSASTSLTRGMSRRVLRGASQSCYRRCIRTVTVGPLNLTRCMPPEVPRTRNRASAQARGVAAVFCCPSGNGLPSCWLRIVNACFRAMYRLRPWCGRFAFPPAISDDVPYGVPDIDR